MGRVLHSATLVPRGLSVEDVEAVDGAMTITARSPSTSAPCPSCDQVSSRLHSGYTRRLADLPSGGRRVVVRLIVRRFRCTVGSCRMRIFAERLHPDVAAVYARRTARLECIVHHLGLALGGRPAASFARRLMLPVSNDTLLWTIRRRAVRPAQVPTVIGIDDWAYKRGQLYGTLVCDLERRQVVTLLPDRDNGTVEAWLTLLHLDPRSGTLSRVGDYPFAGVIRRPQRSTTTVNTWR